MNAKVVPTLGDGAESATTVMSVEAGLPETGPKVLDHAGKILFTLFHDLMRSAFCGFGTRLARQRAGEDGSWNAPSPTGSMERSDESIS